jgi:hypothetical protein
VNRLKMVGDNYTVTATGSLVGDEFLAKLWADRFAVQLYTDGENAQAGIEDTSGAGRGPCHEDLWTFSERQAKYSKELKLRGLNAKMRRRK